MLLGHDVFNVEGMDGFVLLPQMAIFTAGIGPVPNRCAGSGIHSMGHGLTFHEQSGLGLQNGKHGARSEAGFVFAAF